MLVPLEELSQPPSGGCVLKRNMCLLLRTRSGQPPSGGCVLKPSLQSGLI